MDNDKQWYLCPNCGQKLLKKDDNAVCTGVYDKCKKCRKEIEIKIGGFTNESRNED